MHIIKLKKFYFINKLNLENLNKLNEDVSVIYRKYTGNVDEKEIVKIKRICKKHRRMFFISNNFKLALKHSLDGVYLPSFNNSLKHNVYGFRKNFQIIGSAHNIKELNLKKLQGCSSIIFSRLFETSYKYKKGFLGVVKFNLLRLSRKENLIPLGGIRLSNLNKLSTVKCNSIALSSEIIKKPIVLSKRLF